MTQIMQLLWQLIYTVETSYTITQLAGPTTLVEEWWLRHNQQVKQDIFLRGAMFLIASRFIKKH